MRQGQAKGEGWRLVAGSIIFLNWQVDTSGIPLAPLPISLQHLVDTSLDAVRAHLLHQLTPRQRNAIYAHLESVDHLAYPSVRGWLGIIAARRVMPIFLLTTIAM